MLGLAEQQFSTAGLRPEEQFEVWREVVHSVFASANVRRAQTTEGPPDFTSACQGRRIGDLHLAWLETAPGASTSSASRPGDTPPPGRAGR